MTALENWKSIFERRSWVGSGGSTADQRMTAPGAERVCRQARFPAAIGGNPENICSLRGLPLLKHSRHSEILVQRRSYSAPYQALPSHACAGPLVLFTSDVLLRQSINSSSSRAASASPRAMRLPCHCFAPWTTLAMREYVSSYCHLRKQMASGQLANGMRAGQSLETRKSRRHVDARSKRSRPKPIIQRGRFCHSMRNPPDMRGDISRNCRCAQRA